MEAKELGTEFAVWIPFDHSFFFAFFAWNLLQSLKEHLLALPVRLRF
jgi:hypothetical protein